MFSNLSKKFSKFNSSTPFYLKLFYSILFMIFIDLSVHAPSLYFDKLKNSTVTEIKNNSDLISFINNNKISTVNIIAVNSKLLNIELFLNEKEFILFSNIKEGSFIFNIEKILIEKNIPYFWKEEKPIISNFPFVNFLFENGLSISLLLLIVFMITKQGLLFNKDKFTIDFNDKLSDEERASAMDNLVGMDDIKKELLIIKHMIDNKEEFKKRGIETTFNYLFSGHSGTGKTQIAISLSKLLGIPFIYGTGNIETGIVGGGPNVIKNLYNTAISLAKNHKSKMALIFLDEAQSLLLERGQHKEKWADDASNELLAYLNGVYNDKNKEIGVNIIFIAASNFDEKNHKFDKAMMSRFQKKIFFRLPNLEERIDLYKFYINKIDSEFVDENINYPFIAEISSKASPRIIESIVKEATLLSIENNSKIDTKLLELSFERIFVGKTDRETTSNQIKTKNIVALHELGHFISHFQNSLNNFLREENLKFNVSESKDINEHNLGYFYQLNKEQKNKALSFIKEDMKVLKISIESISQINALGYVLNKDSKESLKTRNELEDDIIALYGGLAAERHFSKRKGDFSTGSSNDIEKISIMLDKMVNKLSMYSKFKLNLSHINVDMKRVNTKIICNLSDKFYSISFENIKQYESLILHINSILLEKYVIKIDEVIDIINSFYCEES